MNEKEVKKAEIFSEIEIQINKMDNKSGLLISAIGIVFALTIDLFSIFSQAGFLTAGKCYKVFCYLFSIMYISSFILSMAFFVLTIFPRKNKKQKTINEEKIHINYYYDLSELQRENSFNKEKRNQIFNKKIEEELRSGENLTNQIFTNADICRRKHDNLNAGIKTLIPFVISLVGLIILLMVGARL